MQTHYSNSFLFRLLAEAPCLWRRSQLPADRRCR